MTDWKPIEESNIKLGKPSGPFLLYVPGVRSWNRVEGMPDVMVGIWNGANWLSDVGDVDQGYESTGAWFEHEPLQPTHFMEIPELPL